jgi:hypothetical protein
MWDNANEIVGKLFLDGVKGGALPLGTSIPAVYQKIDRRKTVEAFGKWRDYEEIVKSVVSQCVELKEKEL